LHEPLDGPERGFLLETWLLHELRAAIAAQNLGGRLQYWSTPSGSEIDFVWIRGRRAVGIEIKAATTWKPPYGSVLKELADRGVLTAAHGVYTGSAELKDGPIRIWPIMRFLHELTEGSILR
jgi:predicted AAA+ superfamily ATPase